MTADADTLERELARDLGSVGAQLADDRLWQDLYKALANTRWRKARGEAGGGGRRPETGGQGHVTLSWKRAEDIVNGVASEQGEEPMTLAQTGGEGEVSPRIAELLEPLGWSSAPQDTSTHDPRHEESPGDPPPGASGGGGAEPDWKREGDAAADSEQLRRLG